MSQNVCEFFIFALIVYEKKYKQWNNSNNTRKRRCIVLKWNIGASCINKKEWYKQTDRIHISANTPFILFETNSICMLDIFVKKTKIIGRKVREKMLNLRQVRLREKMSASVEGKNHIYLNYSNNKLNVTNKTG